MNTIIFDTHHFIKELVSAGMPEKQAEVIANQQARLINESLSTKRDLKELELRITTRIGAMIIALGAFLAAIKFFA